MNDQQEQILAFERRFYRTASSKENAIQDELSLSAVRYYMMLNQLLDDHEAIATEPILVARLRRIRDARLNARRTS